MNSKQVSVSIFYLPMKFQVAVTDLEYPNLDTDFNNVSCRINRAACGFNNYSLEAVTP